VIIDANGVGRHASSVTPSGKCDIAELAALGNLHIDTIPVRNVSEDTAALADLEANAGKSQAPCLVIGDRATHEVADIMRNFAERTTDING
jgi:hypothetical protein